MLYTLEIDHFRNNSIGEELQEKKKKKQLLAPVSNAAT